MSGIPSRFALRFDPPTVVVEYTLDTKRPKHLKITARKLHPQVSARASFSRASYSVGRPEQRPLSSILYLMDSLRDCVFESCKFYRAHRLV